MSDKELESACADEARSLSPWAYWTSELYSVGSCLRHYARYPRFLPLYVYSDHGVGLNSSLYRHEATNSARVFFTFHPLKAKRNSGRTSKHMVHVPHPWIHYRRSRKIERLPETKGTLVFLTHHTPGLRWENAATDEYFEMLRALPERCYPIVICLHMHDIVSGNHRELRRYGFPIVTAGNTASDQFVDRFYDLISGFSYATSQGWGSQVAYCVELGVPYFFLGSRPRLVNLSHEELPLGEVPYQDEDEAAYDRTAATLFSFQLNGVTPEQKRFVESLLGLESRVSRSRVSWILWREFFFHWRDWWSSLLKPICGSVRKYGVLATLQKVRRRLSGQHGKA